MATATKAPMLSDQDLAELLSMTKGADSIQLKLTVPVSDRSRLGRNAKSVFVASGSGTGFRWPSADGFTLLG